jgi:DNA modification methylase
VHVTEGLRALPDESVHCAVTSPPYWGLRDYGVAGQIGLEDTPEEYVERLVGVFRELRRALRMDGTFWLNVGDCFADKNLVGVPWRLAFALQADGWYLRSDIIWSKPNPMPESIRDRPTKAHEYVFLLSRSERYFFDQEAVKQRALNDGRTVKASGKGAKNSRHDGVNDRRISAGFTQHDTVIHGRNIRDVWHIATQPFAGAHFATFPERLPSTCVRAGTSERGCCPECGAPWERVMERKASIARQGKGYTAKCTGRNDGDRPGSYTGNISTTVGWRPTCEHDADPVPCTVLDPFMGSGTTLFAAKMLGRHAIGFDISEEYCRIADRRCSLQRKGGVLRKRKRLRIKRKGGS